MKNKKLEVDIISIKALRNILQEGKIRFEYEKKDGSKRQAYGTLWEGCIPDDKKPSGMGYVGSNLRYYDLDKEAWRSIGTDVSTVKII